MKSKLASVLFIIAVCSAGCVSCSPDGNTLAPLFPNTDRIEIDQATLSIATGTLRYTLPNGHCKYVVIGLFDGAPGVNIDNVLTKDMGWGTRTNFKDFVVNAQVWEKLYKYDNATGDFNENVEIDIATLPDPTISADSWYVAIWAYDEGYTLVASSPALPTVP